MEKISIIITVYNSAQTIVSCLDSVIAQTNSNLEILIINDGSTDESSEIIDKYASIDSRIITINQGNKGVSSARNRGIKESTGEYIQFVDSDDCLRIDACEKFLDEMKSGDFDLIISGMERRFYRKKDVIIAHISMKKHSFIYNEISDFFLELYKSNYLNAPVNKIYKSSIIKDKEILFDEEMKLGEDLIFNLDYLKNINKVKVINDELYIINETSNISLTRSFNVEKINQLKILYIKVDDFIKDFPTYVKCSQTNALIYLRSIFICFEHLFTLDIKIFERQSYINSIINDTFFQQIRKKNMFKSLEFYYYYFFTLGYYTCYFGSIFRKKVKNTIRKLKSMFL